MVQPDTATTLADIRRAVKHQLGREAATYRFTQEEKRALRELVYTYEGAGIRTSENEILRLALNWLITDYRQRGRGSILARVLEEPEE